MIISELHIYPIKSLGGISLTEAIVEPKGFRHDRRFMLVSPDGTFMTQRSHHTMALIDVAIAGTPDRGEVVRVWHRYYPSDVLTIPLSVQPQALSEFTMPLLVEIWDSKDVPAVTVSAEADHWFSTVLGEPCRLVFMPDGTQRAVDPAYARDADTVSFADGYPYLLIGQASLNDLNQRLAEPISMLRFRPNIVVSDTEPYEEDAWTHFRMNGLNFYGVKPCARCVLTTIDPATGQPGKEPLRTLKTYRQWKHKILFGQNVLTDPTVTTDKPVVLRVGQSIDVISRQQPWLAPPVSV